MFKLENQAGKNKMWLILLVIIIFIVGWLLWPRSKATKPPVETSSITSQKQNSETAPQNPDSGELQGESTDSASSTEETQEPATPLTVSTTNYYFEHKIGSSPCPQKIGDIDISGRGKWKISGSLPAWIRLAKTTGSAPDNFAINFNCILSQYINQELNGTLIIDLTNSASEISSQTINVSGSIKE